MACICWFAFPGAGAKQVFARNKYGMAALIIKAAQNASSGSSQPEASARKTPLFLADASGYDAQPYDQGPVGTTSAEETTKPYGNGWYGHQQQTDGSEFYQPHKDAAKKGDGQSK